MPKPGVEVKRIYIDSTVELMADHDERGWRATFYTTGMEHSPTSATGTGWEPHAVPRDAAGGKLRTTMLQLLIARTASGWPDSALCCGTHRGNRSRCPLQIETNNHEFIRRQRDGKTDFPSLFDKVIDLIEVRERVSVPTAIEFASTTHLQIQRSRV
jgi:hypothetical protein